MVRQSSLARAEQLYRAADYAAAAALLDGERASSPTDPTILRLLGLCRLRLGDATLRSTCCDNPPDSRRMIH
jgi:uncharacterized protein HemY